MPTCTRTLRARGRKDADVLYSFPYCFILTLDLQQYTHKKKYLIKKLKLTEIFLKSEQTTIIPKLTYHS